MEKETFWSMLKQEAEAGYKLIFHKEWPSWLAGIFLALLALIIFMWWHTWGVAGGYNNWGSWIYYLLGLFEDKPAKTPLMNGMSMSNIGIVVGAFASALLSKQFKINPAPRLEYAKGLLGGILMGIGAALAAGCNVGGFYCAVAMFDFGGICMMLGLFAGAYLGLRYLLWEMENLPQQSFTGGGKTSSPAWDKAKPYVGGLMFLLVLLAFQIFSLLDQNQMGGLLFFGFLIGMVMHRSRFCFSNAFREPFMTGDGRRAVL